MPYVVSLIITPFVYYTVSGNDWSSNYFKYSFLQSFSFGFKLKVEKKRSFVCASVYSDSIAMLITDSAIPITAVLLIFSLNRMELKMMVRPRIMPFSMA